MRAAHIYMYGMHLHTSISISRLQVFPITLKLVLAIINYLKVYTFTSACSCQCGTLMRPKIADFLCQPCEDKPENKVASNPGLPRPDFISQPWKAWVRG